MLVIAPAVPETFLPEAEDGFVRMGPLSCGSHSARQYPWVMFELSGLPI